MNTAQILSELKNKEKIVMEFDARTKHFSMKFEIAMLGIIRHDLLNHDTKHALKFIDIQERALEQSLKELNYTEE